jgi:pimeloyl-ACP methyl ester carboxylesterase
LEGFLAAAAARARQLIESAGQKVEYRSFPQMGHAMHQQDPKLFAATVIEWADSLLAQRAV